MPSPNKNESKSDFMSRCVPKLIEEGRAQNQAVAICSSMYERPKKSKAAQIWENIMDNLILNAE